MGSYLLLYHGGMPPGTPEEGEQVMKAWTDWMGGLGANLETAGNPTSTTKTIAADGSVSDATSGVTGYSVIKADSWDDAVKTAIDLSAPHVRRRDRGRPDRRDHVAGLGPVVWRMHPTCMSHRGSRRGAHRAYRARRAAARP